MRRAAADALAYYNMTMQNPHGVSTKVKAVNFSELKAVTPQQFFYAITQRLAYSWACR